VNARVAYQHAADSPAATFASSDLHDAHMTLNDAERSFGATGDSKETRRIALEAEAKADEAATKCQTLACPMPEPKIVTNTVTRTVVEQKLLTIPASVLFAFDQDTLLPGATKHLEAAVSALRTAKADKKEVHVIVEGHTDSIGTAEYNQKLSERRADAVRNYLVAHGQDASFVTVRAKGLTEPFTSNETVEGRSNNRRVEIYISKPADK
jgi:OOP family OmpA-OmpF porin